MTPYEDALRNAVRNVRIQPYIAFMGRALGFFWFQLSSEARTAITEMVDGSPGLDDKVIEWAAEFDKSWEERLAILPDGEDFMEQIASFTDMKIKSMLAEARLS